MLILTATKMNLISILLKQIFHKIRLSYKLPIYMNGMAKSYLWWGKKSEQCCPCGRLIRMGYGKSSTMMVCFKSYRGLGCAG